MQIMTTNILYIDDTKKYIYHDEPHAFETSMEYMVLATNNNSMNETNADLDGNVTATNDNHSRLASSTAEHIYSNSHFKFEVLETTV